MSGGGNGCDRELAEALVGQEKHFAEVVRAIALARDPEWQRKNAGLIAAVRRWQGED